MIPTMLSIPRYLLDLKKHPFRAIHFFLVSLLASKEKRRDVFSFLFRTKAIFIRLQTLVGDSSKRLTRIREREHENDSS